MGHSFPNFRKNSNYDYQKSSLTSISEYQKLPALDPAAGIIKKLRGEAKAAGIAGTALTAP